MRLKLISKVQKALLQANKGEPRSYKNEKKTRERFPLSNLKPKGMNLHKQRNEKDVN